MNPADKLQIITKHIKQIGFHSNDKVIHLDDDLYSDLGFDSLDNVELAMALEHDFKISIPDDEVEWWQTVSQVLHSVRNV